MPNFATYDPKQVVVVVGPAILSGFEDGTFVEIERSADLFTKKTGVDGGITRAKSADKSGTLTVTLQQASSSNDVLMSLYNLDETASSGSVPISVKDMNGRTVWTASSAWIKKIPKTQFDKSDKPRTWVFDCADLTPFVGGTFPA